MRNGPAWTERITGESEGKEALEMMAEVVVEGRYALIGGGEAAFFWIAWRQASRNVVVGWRANASCGTREIMHMCERSL